MPLEELQSHWDARNTFYKSWPRKALSWITWGGAVKSYKGKYYVKLERLKTQNTAEIAEHTKSLACICARVHVCVCLTKKTFEDTTEDEISRNKDVAVWLAE